MRSDEWRTPADLFRRLDHEFGFTLDAAANHENHLKEDEMKERIKTFGMCVLTLCVIFGGPLVAGLIEGWLL